MVAAFVAALLPGLALAQNTPIYQSGTTTVGHAPMWIAPGVQGDAGGAAAGKLTELGITNTGTPFCINDAPVGAQGGYHQFCLGAFALGNGLISYNAYGGAAALGLEINLNGVNYPFPGTGNGNVIAPTSPLPVAGNAVVWNGGTAVKDGGAPPALSVATNTGLEALSTAAVPAVLRTGFYQQGDVPQSVLYYASSSPCSLNGGNGDNGTQVKSSNSGCWLASTSLSAVKQWGATGSAVTATASGTAAGTTVTLAAAGDFANQNRVAIVGGGASSLVGVPTAVTVATEGTTGSTTWCARLVSIDTDHGYSAASSEACDAGNGNASNIIATGTAFAQDQLVSWTPAAGATSVAVYFGPSGNETCQGVEAVGGVKSTNTFRYYGQDNNWIADCPAWLPNTPPSVAGADLYRGTIVAGGGTTSLTVSPALTNSISTALIEHDDTAALEAAVTASQAPVFSAGQYNLTQPLTLTVAGQILEGCGPSCSMLHFDGDYDAVTFANNGGTQLYYTGMEKMGLLSQDMASGFSLVVNGPNGIYLNEITMFRPYDEMELDNVFVANIQNINDWSHPISNATAKRRGDVGLYLMASEPRDVGVVNFNYYNGASSYNPYSLYFSGCVASFRTEHIGLQQSPAPQVAFDNAPNCIVNGQSVGPQFPILKTLGVNGAWPPQPGNNAGAVSIAAGKDIEFIEPFIQYTGPNSSGSAINCLSGVSGVSLVAGQVFGGGSDDLNDNCFGMTISGTHLYSAFRADIECGANATNLTVSGDSSNLVSGTPVSATQYGVLLDSGCQNASIHGHWQGSTANVDDQASPATVVTIDGVPAGSPPTSIINASGDQTLTVASLPNLYLPTGCAVLDQSGFSAPITDTTDTATNILGNLADPQVGQRGCIIINNHQNSAITIAGGAGVTVSGQGNVPANAGSNMVAFRRFIWTIDNTGTPALHLQGCVLSGNATC